MFRHATGLVKLSRSLPRSPAAARAAHSPSGQRPPPKSRLLRVALLGVYGVGSAALGFYLTTSPLGGALARLGMRSDQASLGQYAPRGDAERAVESFIDSHPITQELRRNPAMTESRPHMKLPAPFRPHNLTAGTLMGPGRMTVPPFAWAEAGSKSLVTITHLGSDLCGHPGIVHGGVLATMLDEGLARCCWDALPRQMAVTAKLEVVYRKPTHANSYVVLRAKTVKVEGRKAWVTGHIETLVNPGEEPQILAEATGLFISPRPATILTKFL